MSGSLSIASILTNFKIDNYNITYEPLGKGASSSIFPVVSVKGKTGKIKLVIKLYCKAVEKEREVQMLQFISNSIDVAGVAKQKLHDHFIGLEEHGDFPSPYAVFELCQKNLKQHFSDEVIEDEVLMELKKILSVHLFPAIIFLHENEIVHGDIKAENIMFANRHWKIIDFGYSCFKMEESKGGSYIPPEYRRDFESNVSPRATVKVDSFALGVLMMDILFIDHPGCPSYWHFIENDPNFTDYTIPLPEPPQMIGGHALYDKVAELLAKDPDDRKTVRKFSSSAFFNDHVITKDFQIDLIHGQQKALDVKLTDLLQGQNKIIETQQPVIINMPPRNPMSDTKVLSIFYAKYRLWIFAGVGGLFIAVAVAVALFYTVLSSPSKAAPPSSSNLISYRQVSFGSSDAGYTDGTLSVAQFNAPSGIAVDERSNLYISDTGNNVIRCINTSLVVSTIAGHRLKANLSDGFSDNAHFKAPGAIAVSKESDYLIVADVENHAIRKIDISSQLVTTIGGNGSPGYSDTGKGQFNNPNGVALDSLGNVYIADTSNNCIRKIDSSGVVTTIAMAGFKSPMGIIIDRYGTLLVADSGNAAIKMITADGTVSTFFPSSSSKMKRSDYILTAPIGLAVDSSGYVYVIDRQNGILVINGSSQTISPFTEVIIPADATMAGIALSTNGSIYVTNQKRNNIQAAIVYVPSSLTTAVPTISGTLTTASPKSSNIAIYFTDDPYGSFTAGSRISFSPSIQIQALDRNNRGIPSLMITLAAYLDIACTKPGEGTLSLGQKTTNSFGSIFLSGFSYTRAEEIYIKASGGGSSQCSSTSITITPASPQYLLWKTSIQESTLTTGSILSSHPALRLSDSYDNPIGGVSVTLSFYSDSYCSSNTASDGLIGNVASTSNDGVASFSLLRQTVIGKYYMKASSNNLTSICSTNRLSVTSGPTFNLSFSTQDYYVTAGSTFNPSPAVIASDAYGNSVSNATITLSAFRDPLCTVMASTALGNSTSSSVMTGSNGLARFTSISYTVAETIYLGATSGALTSCSKAILVTKSTPIISWIQPFQNQSIVAGNSFLTMPVVRLSDQFGNLFNQSVIELSLYSDNSCQYYSGSFGTGSITATTNSSGYASFNSTFSITTRGTFYVKATATVYMQIYSYGSYYYSTYSWTSSCSPSTFTVT